ncbi:hypothetical protein ACP6PM_29845, partial [Dapis sp. BLCC M229]
QENLPLPKFITPLKSQYLRLNYDSHHIINDYIILAQKSNHLPNYIEKILYKIKGRIWDITQSKKLS